ncbi:MAG: DNRLRE domain-containing protein [Pyrinomonadaceae bacterium]
MRQGNVFTGFISGDGVSWKQVSSATVRMAEAVNIGLAVSSHSNSALCRAVIDHVWVGAAGDAVGVLAPQADAYVQDGASSATNFGSTETLHVKRSSSTGLSRQTYLKFEVGNFAQRIKSARLRVYGQLTSTNSANVPVGVYSVTDTGWDENQLTWSNKPSSATALLSGFMVTDTRARWHEVDITAYVEAERTAGRGTISLVLKGTKTSSAYPTFNAREASGERPELVIATGEGWNAKVNFQPAGATVPSGYLADAGAIYGERGGGYAYGWSADASANTRDRNSSNSPDQRFDTLIFMQKYGAHTWEMAVPNGTYQVKVVSGDPSYYNYNYRINVEGVLVVDGTSTSTVRWIEGTQVVTVTDGRLTVTNEQGATNNKLCFLEISSR